jgi:hypothetical protein
LHPRIGLSHTPQRDCAPDALATGTPQWLRDDLVALLGADRVLTRPIDLSLVTRSSETAAVNYEIQRKLFEDATSMNDAARQFELKQLIARFLHEHKNDA